MLFMTIMYFSFYNLIFEKKENGCVDCYREFKLQNMENS